jgi:methionyl-tRNA formyltransferase
VRAAFLGTPTAAVPALEGLVAAGHDVRLVVSQPDRPAGRHRSPQPPPVKRAAAALGLTVAQPERARDGSLRALLAEARADVLVVVAYGKILPPDVLAEAPHGAVNVHFSLLPAYRGAAPVQWALARGESRTGVTTMRVEAGLDTGAIYLAREVEIGEGEHAPSLQSRLAEVGARLLLETLAGLERGTISPRPQDPARASVAPRLRREDGAFQVAWTAAELEGRVRGFDPWPGVWASRGGRRVRLVHGRAVANRSTSEPPGRILDYGDGAFHVACGGGTLFALRSLQPEGRRVVEAAEARNGRALATGDLLETPASGR